MTAWTFNQLLLDVLSPDPERAKRALARTKLFRHGATHFDVFGAWLDGLNDRNRHEEFEAYQRWQTGRWFKEADHLAVFAADHDRATVFLGIWRIIGDPAKVDQRRRDKLTGGDIEPKHYIYDLTTTDLLDHYAGRLVIDWVTPEQDKAQFADRNEKPIVELRREIRELPFPGLPRPARQAE